MENRIASSGPQRDTESLLPALDATALQALRELAEATDPELFEEVLQTYLQDAEHHLAALHQAADSGDLSGMKKLGHTLKGSSAQVGAYQVSTLAEELEVLANTGSANGAQDLIEQIEMAFGRTRIAVQHQLNGAMQ